MNDKFESAIMFHGALGFPAPMKGYDYYFVIAVAEYRKCSRAVIGVQPVASSVLTQLCQAYLKYLSSNKTGAEATKNTV